MKHFSMIQCGTLLPNASKALSHTNCFPYFVQVTVLIEMLIFHAIEEIKQPSTLRITLKSHLLLQRQLLPPSG